LSREVLESRGKGRVSVGLPLICCKPSMNDSRPFADRRQASRVNAALPIAVHTSKWSLEAEIRDIGPGGAFILCKQKPDLEETILISFQSGPTWEPAGLDDRPVKIKGRVLRTTAEGFAVRFVDLSDTEQRFLYQVVTDLYRIEFGEKFVNNSISRDGEEEE
jgi:c-di-GMP-binding flagellar brake protein YcgR